MFYHLSSKSLHAATMRILGMTLSYAFILLITQYSSDEAVGRFIFALSIHGLVSTLCLFGTDSSMIYMYNNPTFFEYKTRLEASLVFGVFSWSLFIVIVTLSLIAIIYQSGQRISNVIYILISLPFYTTFIAYITIFRAQERILTFSSLRNIPFYLMSAVIFYILSKTKADIENSIYLAIILSSFICFSLIWLLKVNLNTNLIDKGVILKIFIASTPFLLSSGALIINSNLDILILGVLSHDVSVAVYGINQKITILASFGLLVISIPVAPIFARLIANGEYSTFVYVWRISAGLSLMFAVLYLGSVYALYEEIFNFLNWGSYVDITLFLILAGAQVSNCAAGPVFHALNMSGGAKKVAAIQAITIAINIPNNFLLFKFFDYHGIAISTLISTMLQQALGLLAYKYSNLIK